MIYKIRTKPMELSVLQALERRMDLPTKEKQYYHQLQRGYTGEVLFDSLTEEKHGEAYMLNDLLLQANNTTFQIDSLLISAKKIYLFEVKYYEGDYVYDADKFFKLPQTEILNPLHQLNRAESLLGQLLNRIGLAFPIEASLVFIHPNFTLYQAPLDKPIIYPGQLDAYLAKLQTDTTPLSNRQRKLADKLKSLHMKKSPFRNLPSYDFRELKKGISCSQCHSFSLSVVGRKCLCKECGYSEVVADAVMRNVREFQLLFPDEKVTTAAIHEWCEIVEKKERIRLILADNFEQKGRNHSTYYE